MEFFAAKNQMLLSNRERRAVATVAVLLVVAASGFVPAHGRRSAGAGSPWHRWATATTLTSHATGLESASMGNYIVEAAQNSGQMATVPIAGGGSAIFSEFEADSSGSAQFFTVLMRNPSSA